METLPNSNELAFDIPAIQKAALLFRALNNKQRLHILRLLHKDQQLTVTSIYQTMGMEQSMASQYLSVLRKAGFVQTKKVGKYIYYSINYGKLDEIHRYAGQLLQFTVN